MSKCDDGCDQTPVTCETPRTTYCDRDRKNNVWIEGGDPATGEGGVCLLDNMHREQVVYILERDEIARRDLARVTSDPELQEMALTVPRLATKEEADTIQEKANANTMPFYTAFAGRPPFAQ
jgi:hypothetical protein